MDNLYQACIFTSVPVPLGQPESDVTTAAAIISGRPESTEDQPDVVKDAPNNASVSVLTVEGNTDNEMTEYQTLQS